MSETNATKPLAPAAGSAETLWVRCSERMPDDGQRVRVRDRKGNVSVAIYVCEDGLSGWMVEMRPQEWGSWPDQLPISAWRPIVTRPNAQRSATGANPHSQSIQP